MAGSSAGASSSKGMAAQPHVLVVDDCSVSRKFNELIFKKYECKVTTVESGSKALEFLGLVDDNPSSGNDNQIPKVDMVCTDYSMPPGITGYELLKKIKASTTMKDLPVVIVSAETDPAQKSEYVINCHL
ncbi:hypothetical protein DH2020_010294 [Rehmannia glutinosa]|uniref:Response regulatory domain-containing protein n=1 Tax=Rehmannia glutinosa TaxID=99300 RepID=A0ABR0XA00_REHGL